MLLSGGDPFPLRNSRAESTTRWGFVAREGVAMTDVGLETAGGLSTNGGSELLTLEPKATVLAKDDTVAGKLHLKGSGQVLGSFSGQIECDGDLVIGPEADVEAEIRSVTVTIAGVVQIGRASCRERV